MVTSALREAGRSGNKWAYLQSDRDQLSAITDLVREGLGQGGLGVGIPVGYYNNVSSEEISKIVAAAAEKNSFVTAHVRYMSKIQPSSVLALQEMIALAAINDVPLLIHHLPSSALSSTQTALKMINTARKRGINVVAEVYPYTTGFFGDFQRGTWTRAFRKGWESIIAISPGLKTGETLTQTKLREIPCTGS